MVNGSRASMFADTGAAVTVISKKFWDKSKTGMEMMEESRGKKLVGYMELH